MAALMKFDGIDGESNRQASFLDFDDARGGSTGFEEIEWTLFPGAEKLARIVRQKHPRGVNSILVGVKKVPGYHLEITSNGIIAVLIGLLLPAVQKVHEASSAERRLFTEMLAPGGRLKVSMSTGNDTASGLYELENVFVTNYSIGGGSQA